MPKKLTQKETDEICARENGQMVQAIIKSEMHWDEWEKSETETDVMDAD